MNSHNPYYPETIDIFNNIYWKNIIYNILYSS